MNILVIGDGLGKINEKGDRSHGAIFDCDFIPPVNTIIRFDEGEYIVTDIQMSVWAPDEKKPDKLQGGCVSIWVKRLRS